MTVAGNFIAVFAESDTESIVGSSAAGDGELEAV